MARSKGSNCMSVPQQVPAVKLVSHYPYQQLPEQLLVVCCHCLRGEAHARPTHDMYAIQSVEKEAAAHIVLCENNYDGEDNEDDEDSDGLDNDEKVNEHNTTRRRMRATMATALIIKHVTHKQSAATCRFMFMTISDCSILSLNFPKFHDQGVHLDVQELLWRRGGLRSHHDWERRSEESLSLKEEIWGNCYVGWPERVQKVMKAQKCFVRYGVRNSDWVSQRLQFQPLQVEVARSKALSRHKHIGSDKTLNKNTIFFQSHMCIP